MIDDHRKDIAEFRDEAREGHGAVSDLARRQLPTLRKHLDMAIALDNRGGRFSGNFGQVGESSDWRDRNLDNRPSSEGRNYDDDNRPSSDWRGRNYDDDNRPNR